MPVSVTLICQRSNAKRTDYDLICFKDLDIDLTNVANWPIFKFISHIKTFANIDLDIAPEL